MKAKDLVNLSLEDLKLKHKELNAEIFGLLNELKVSRKLEHPHMLKEKKKDRARILTVLRQQQSKESF